jgi:Resolvase, N terminal domain
VPSAAWQRHVHDRHRALKKARYLSLKVTDSMGLPLCERYVHNVGMMYGYARVSTDGQSVEAQVAALTAAGAVTVYREVASGAKTNRAKLRQVLRRRCAAGDAAGPPRPQHP